MKHIFYLLRTEQWLKNVLIFAPLFFASKFMEQDKLMICLIFFISFSMMASGVYIINDIMDVENDKIHPKKKFRTIASGAISIKSAIIIAAILILGSLIVSYFTSIMACLLIIGYLTLNVLYSLGLKKIALLDLVIIATGFLIRIVLGGIAANVQISVWLILMTFLLSTFILFAKRRDDLVILENTNIKIRDSLDGYNFEFVNAGLIITGSVTIVSYIMYCLSEEFIKHTGKTYLFITSFFVMIGILRYLQLTFVKNVTGNPIQILFKDFFLLGVVALWMVSFYIFLYIQ